jgi:hypothetical protein
MALHDNAIATPAEAFSGPRGPEPELRARLDRDGWARLDPAQTALVLGVDLDVGVPALAAHWDALPPDRYLADGGRSRRRRHACFEVAGADVRRLPHRPHVQRREHNPLFGDLPRWFAPMSPALDDDPTLDRVLRLGAALFTPHAACDAEVHLFRVVADADRPGEPTPEGIHRDGVDGVCVLLVARVGIEGGRTTLTDADGRVLARPLLATRGDALLLDDARVRHGTDAIVPSSPATAGHRDVLVVTFRAHARLQAVSDASSASRGKNRSLA